MKDTLPAVAHRSTAAVLFGSLFTAQACLVVLAPIMPRVASDLQVTVVAIGQLRTVSGVVAAAVAVLVAVTHRRRDLRAMLAAGLGLLLFGTVASAFAPTFAVLVAAQVSLGAGVALTLTGGLTATRQWIPADQRGRALSWALIGQPAAWIIGLPVAGVLGDYNWRLAWLVPLAAGLGTLAGVLRRDRDAPAEPEPQSSPVRGKDVFHWAGAEMLAYAGWTSVLIYAGAMFGDVYGISIGTIGVVLGIGALAYLPGNVLARRWTGGPGRLLLIGLVSAMALTGLVFSTIHPSLGFSLAVFALFAFLGGARTSVGSALGLHLGGTNPLRTMSLRTVSVQFGYMFGAGVGGIGLALAGWSGFGFALTVFLVLSAAALATVRGL